ncbi:hypothetical protein POM88_036262 [Heracleum sosnowskyi]|uniref:AP complex mu/sigma subunit domain-containing protein n=1 Tax=Heracleum sosnowskyi TaxID=360622 RepID=A0AAD8MC90_9APIA|nr:hypothetical protein POM88_036262 [Heracleum sosnowskyi]
MPIGCLSKCVTQEEMRIKLYGKKDIIIDDDTSKGVSLLTDPMQILITTRHHFEEKLAQILVSRGYKGEQLCLPDASMSAILFSFIVPRMQWNPGIFFQNQNEAGRVLGRIDITLDTIIISYFLIYRLVFDDHSSQSRSSDCKMLMLACGSYLEYKYNKFGNLCRNGNKFLARPPSCKLAKWQETSMPCDAEGIVITSTQTSLRFTSINEKAQKSLVQFYRRTPKIYLNNNEEVPIILDKLLHLRSHSLAVQKVHWKEVEAYTCIIRLRCGFDFLSEALTIVDLYAKMLFKFEPGNFVKGAANLVSWVSSGVGLPRELAQISGVIVVYFMLPLVDVCVILSHELVQGSVHVILNQSRERIILYQIHFLLLISRQGKVRLTKWYSPYAQKERTKVVRELSVMILIVYKRYASLYFCMCVNQDDNELEILEIIHHFVQILDLYFGSVCELDLIFNFHKAYYILDKILIAGELQESSKKTVERLIDVQDALVEAAKEQANSVSYIIS